MTISQAAGQAPAMEIHLERAYASLRALVPPGPAFARLQEVIKAAAKTAGTETRTSHLEAEITAIENAILDLAAGGGVDLGALAMRGRSL